MLKIAVVGVGHLGKEHARIYDSLPGVELVSIVDTDEKQLKKIAQKYKAEALSDYRKISHVDAVSVATPTRQHYEICKYFLQKNIHVFVEKPIAQTVDEAQELVEVALKHNMKLQVGHIERFNPIVIEILKRNLQPVYIETLRLSPFRFRSGDIGVTLDLMIHDIDILRVLVKSNVEKIDAIGMNILGKNEDLVNARIQFENGCVANVNTSRTSLKSVREMRIFCPDSYVYLDYKMIEAVVYKKPENIALEDLNLQERIPAKFMGFSFEEIFFQKVLQKEKISLKSSEPLYKELESFITCISENTAPIVSGEDGLQAIRIAKMVTDDVKSNIDKMKSRFAKQNF